MFARPLKRLVSSSASSTTTIKSTSKFVGQQHKVLEYKLHGAGLGTLSSELRKAGPMRLPAMFSSLLGKARSTLSSRNDNSGNMTESSALRDMMMAEPRDMTRKQLQISAKNVYLTLDRLSDPVLEFFYDPEYCNMPFTFQSWFSITQLHVWICQSRCRARNDDIPEDIGKQMIQYMLDFMSSDTELKLWSLGASNPVAADKLMRQLISSHFGCSLAYDEGFEHSDAYLASALWRNMFFMDDEVTGRQLALMTFYVRYQMERLFKETSAKQFLNDGFEWTLPPIGDIDALLLKSGSDIEQKNI